MRFPSDEDEKVASVSHEAVRLTASEFVDDSWKDLKPHKEEEQVKLDVARAFVYYPNCKTLMATQLNSSLQPIYIPISNQGTTLTSPR